MSPSHGIKTAIMVTEGHCPQMPSAGALSSGVKKRRTTDSDWEKYRLKIIRLYIYEKKSREDVIAIMKHENGLDITEKQLKYRIEEKWKVRKNGIRKSFRRAQSLETTSALRSCSSVYCSGIIDGSPRCECLRKPELASINFSSADVNTSSSGMMPFMQLNDDSYSSSDFFVSNDDFEMFTNDTLSESADPPPWMAQRAMTTKLFPEVSTTLPQYGPYTSSSGHAHTWCDPSLTRICDSVPYASSHGTNTVGYCDVFDFQARPLALLGDSKKPTGSDNPHISLSKPILSFPGTTNANDNQFDQLYSRQAIRVNSKHNAREQINCVAKDPYFAHNTQLNNSPTRHDNARNPASSSHIGFEEENRMLFRGIDPEYVLWPLQKLERYILKGPNNAIISTHRQHSHQSISKLSKALQSDRIRSGINTILGLIYQSLAEKRLNASAVSLDCLNQAAEQRLLPLSDRKSLRMCRLSQDATRVVSRAAMKYYTSEATITAELRELLPKEYMAVKEPYPHSIYISYMPNVDSGSPGISLAFVGPDRSSWEYGIAPSLRAFNVIPNTSQIVRFVKTNNLDAVRMYLQTGKASVDDISSDGHALLMNALVSESWDVFELLVREGADIQHCTLYSKTYDLITCIWRVWLHCFSPSASSGNFGTQKSQKLIEMINLAKSYGCDIVSGADGLMHPNISFHHLSRKSSGNNDDPSITTNPAKCFMHQVCDIEQRNDQGQSALLFEAMVPGLRALTRLEVFLSLKADHTAIDIYGRGALHSVLFLKGSQSHETSLDEEDWFTDYGFLSDESRPWTSSQIDYYDPTPWTSAGTNSEDTTSKNDDMIAMHCNPATHYTVYPKLVALLSVGCDPNLLDNMALTPSDYALRNGRWSYWMDALDNCGWVYDSMQGLCLRRID